MFSLISLLLITTLLSLSQSEFPCLLVPEDATTWVPFGSGDLGIWIKPAYWKHTQTSPDASLSPTIKLLMNFIDNSIFFALSVLPGTLDVNNIKSNLENNLKKSGLEFVRIVDMHSCEVNGLSTIYVKVEGGLMQTLINYDILFYSERNTSYQLSVYSVAGVTEREEMEICDFLSGFAKSDKENIPEEAEEAEESQEKLPKKRQQNKKHRPSRQEKQEERKDRKNQKREPKQRK